MPTNEANEISLSIFSDFISNYVYFGKKNQKDRNCCCKYYLHRIHFSGVAQSSLQCHIRDEKPDWKLLNDMQMQSVCAGPWNWKHDIYVGVTVGTYPNPSSWIKTPSDYKDTF